MRKWYPWLLVIIAAGSSAVLYGRLPDPLPTHWDASGNVNGYSPKVWGAWLMPAILLVMTVVLPRLPAIDPRRENYEKFWPTYILVINAVMTMLFVIHLAMLAVALGWAVPMERIAPVLVGALLIVLGNVLPRARPNWMFGIRTPWTLTNDRVWERTHRLGGILFVLAGIALVVAGLFIPGASLPVIVGSVVTASVVPLVYSYFAWRKEAARARHS